MRLAVLVPVKRFSAAKGRLIGVVPDPDRARLARWMATGVLASVGEFDRFVACDDPEVRDWAGEVGADVIWGPQLGLNRAVDDGVAEIARRGFDHVIVSHADLPLPRRLPSVARARTCTLVPDRRADGTNVMSFPLDSPIRASYGGGSFRRHLASARRRLTAGVAVEVRRDPELSLDLDTVDDLTHPLVTHLLAEVLPSWLPTNQASRSR